MKITEFLSNQIEGNNYEVLKYITKSRYDIYYKVRLTKHVYNTESAEFLSKAFLVSNKNDLIEKEYYIISITRKDLAEPIYLDVALDDSKHPWGVTLDEIFLNIIENAEDDILNYMEDLDDE